MFSAKEKDDYLSMLISNPSRELIEKGIAIAYELEADGLVTITQTYMGVAVRPTKKGEAFEGAGGHKAKEKYEFAGENKKSARQITVNLIVAVISFGLGWLANHFL